MVMLLAAERGARPWKNGSGITQDVASFPPGSGLDNFDWRLSIAEVIDDGPFSSFPGVDRHLLVLSGQLRLLQADEPPHVIGTGDPPITFSGDRSLVAQLVAGPVSDLNLMVRRTAYTGRLRRFSDWPLISEATATIVLAPAAASVAVDDTNVHLRELDALVLGPARRINARADLLVAEIYQSS